MNNIGLVYSADEINAHLSPPSSPDGDLVGLLFARGHMVGETEVISIPNEFSIFKVYFNPLDDANNFSFNSSRIVGLNKTKFYRGDGSGLLKEPTNPKTITKLDEIQYVTNKEWRYSFFSLAELQILINLSTEIIISGAQAETGAIAFPGDQKQPFPTLVAEANVNRNVIATTDEPVPAFALGLPCPPFWELGVSGIMGMSDGLLAKVQKCCCDDRPMKKTEFQLKLRSAWAKFNEEFEKTIPGDEVVETGATAPNDRGGPNTNTGGDKQKKETSLGKKTNKIDAIKNLPKGKFSK